MFIGKFKLKLSQQPRDILRYRITSWRLIIVIAIYNFHALIACTRVLSSRTMSGLRTHPSVHTILTCLGYIVCVADGCCSPTKCLHYRQMPLPNLGRSSLTRIRFLRLALRVPVVCFRCIFVSSDQDLGYGACILPRLAYTNVNSLNINTFVPLPTTVSDLI